MNNSIKRIMDRGFIAFGSSDSLDKVVPVSDQERIAENRKRYETCKQRHPTNSHQYLYFDKLKGKAVWGELKDLEKKKEKIFCFL